MPLRITLGCGKHPQAAEKSARNASLGATTVFAVRVEVPNSDHALKPGMPADATIVE